MRLDNVKDIGILFVLLTASPTMAQDEFKTREEASAALATKFIHELGTSLKESMADGGPEAAIAVCRDIAPTIANELSLLNGWKVTRVGTRVRNTMMGIPDAWEQDGLEYFSEEINRGTIPANMSYTALVTEGNQHYFRFMRPIVTQPLCLICHGASDTVPPTVQTVLDQHYPHDQAINYTVGELRGAVSIKQPMD